jgi:hypothetical protein
MHSAQECANSSIRMTASGLPEKLGKVEGFCILTQPMGTHSETDSDIEIVNSVELGKRLRLMREKA